MQQRRIALVTGANRGIGRATAYQLAVRHDMHILLGVRNIAQGNSVAREITAAGGSATVHQLDITNPQQIKQLARELTERFGRLDVLVNNAAILLETDENATPGTVRMEAVRSTFETNFFGAWALTQAVLPLMRQHHYGRVVNMSSGIAAFQENDAPGEMAPAYRISKAALNALTVSLAAEMRGMNILVNAACPGYVRTETHNLDAERTTDEGTDTPVWLATLPENGPTGGIFRDRQRIPW